MCSECGFKAAHPAGLGRHRTAIHGAISKSELSRRRAGRRRASTDAQLTRRVGELERRHDRLLSGLEQLAASCQGREEVLAKTREAHSERWGGMDSRAVGT